MEATNCRYMHVVDTASMRSRCGFTGGDRIPSCGCPDIKSVVEASLPVQMQGLTFGDGGVYVSVDVLADAGLESCGENCPHYSAN